MSENDNIIFFTEDRPTRADAVKNREHILQTASRLFQQHGVESVSMTQLAQQAAVGKGTLYRHFNNKWELCHALLDEDMRSVQAETLKRLNQKEPPCQMLRWFLQEIVLFVDRNHELLFVGTENDTVSALDTPAHLWWRQTIRGLLEQASVVGDLEYISDVFYVLLDVNTINFQRRSRGYSITQVVDGLMMTLDRFLPQ